ncbi:DNA-binding transcriptional regulator, GntR family [Micromonospora pallida]|uniref:DNA-binding transcriptional regulator, GntR family n=1 Tax=Micromonospora pallida TaxID=145854 RepID=A0A1C6SBS9_9ACTN|nr:GntR family transcriptional regulator [Micromonospora pallida]SCL26940.1 DNA-binding transcriptional regulator, GntR family [Micromonospora pallida]
MTRRTGTRPADAGEPMAGDPADLADGVASDAVGRDATAGQYQRLRRELIEGRYRPGTLLLETAVSADHGVSRTPVREAMARLEQDGLLERAVRGYRVRTRSPEEVLDVYEARIALESHVAATAAIRHTALDLALLRHIQEQALRAEDPVESRRLDGEFHRALRQAAHNVTTAELLERLDAQMALYGNRATRDRSNLDLTRAEHERVLDAVARRDPQAARERLTEHLTRVRDLRIAELVEGRD